MKKTLAIVVAAAVSVFSLSAIAAGRQYVAGNARALLAKFRAEAAHLEAHFFFREARFCHD